MNELLLATTVLNMFKTVVAFPDLRRSAAMAYTVRPESGRCRHKRVTDVPRFITIS